MIFVAIYLSVALITLGAFAVAFTKRIRRHFCVCRTEAALMLVVGALLWPAQLFNHVASRYFPQTFHRFWRIDP